LDVDYSICLWCQKGHLYQVSYRVARCKHHKTVYVVGRETTDNKGMNLINFPYNILFVGTSLRVGRYDLRFQPPTRRFCSSCFKWYKTTCPINKTSGTSMKYFCIFNNSTSFGRMEKRKRSFLIVVVVDGWMDNTTVFYTVSYRSSI